MSGASLLHDATNISFTFLLIALALVIIRLIRGPTLADRILSLDVIATLAIGMIATFALRTGFTLYLDIAISMGLLGFLSTVAFARYLLLQAAPGVDNEEEQ